MPALLPSFVPTRLTQSKPSAKPAGVVLPSTGFKLAQTRRQVSTTAQTQNTQVQRDTKKQSAPAHGLPQESRRTAQPDSPRGTQHPTPSDISASDRTYSILVKDRGGTIPKDMQTTQQRLQEVLSVDRQDTPPPGSQVREGYQVVATVIFPQDELPMLLPQAAEALLSQHFSSLTAAKKAIRRKELLVEGKVCNTTRVVSPGERMEWIQRVSTNKRLDQTQKPTKLQVVYEDEHMACIVKPPGMSTAQSGVAGKEDVRQCLPYSLKLSEVPGLLCRPQHVHRLDEATGGLLVVAKSRQGLKGLSAAFEHRQVQKTYRTLVGGRLEGQGYVDIPLDGKPSLTEYRAVSQTESGNHGWISTLELLPHTGRMHQLRRHMALLGHPVLGDARYTYGYASRHPDAPIRLTHAQAQQAMATPFGFTCDHPYCTPDTAAAVSYAFWASQRLGLASKQLGPGPATESEQLGSASQQSEVLATSSLPEAPLHITSEAVMGRTPPKKIKDRPLPAASASTRLDPPVTASGIQKGRSKGAETEPFQASLQLNRPNRAVAPQQSMQAANPAKGFDPCLTDLSLEAHMRLAAGAPHYAATLAKQDRSAMAQHQIQELPAELQRVLCLWAVKLMMPHPLTQAEMQFSIPDPPMFHHMRDAEADLAWKLRQKNSQ